jgi:hypothetical protein
MKHKVEAAPMTASPFAATILPGTGRTPKTAKDPKTPKTPRRATHLKAAAPMATVAASAPAAIGAPTSLPTLIDAPVVGLDQPPAGHLALDLRHSARPTRGRSRRGRIVALAVALALALGAAAYLELPKLRSAKTATGPATIAFPLTIDNVTRSAPTARGLPTLSALKGDTPALAAAHLATYGAKSDTVVLAGLLPTTLRGSTPARRLALAASINATAREQLLGPGRLALVTQPNTSATLQCAFVAAVLTSTSRTGCVWVDGEAILVTSVVNPSATAGIAATKRVIAEVERH